MKNIYTFFIITAMLLSLSIDVSARSELQAVTYTNSHAFLKAEGNTCKVATDGCNTVFISNGELGGSTEMYCHDIYSDQGEEKWSCLDDSLEEQRIGFLSDNDTNLYYHVEEKLGDIEVKRVEAVIGKYTSIALEKAKYNTKKSLRKLDTLISYLEKNISELIMSYPADAGMSEKDTKKYYILTLAKFETMIVQERWKRNAGIQ